MLIYILLVLFICMLALSYKIFNREIVHPAVIFCFMYSVSILSAVYNISAWNINLVEKTFWILFLGGMEFILISYVIKKLFEKKYSSLEEKTQRNIEDLNLNKVVFLLLNIFSIIVIVLLVFNVLKIAGRFGTYHSFTQAQSLFKAHTSYSNDASVPHYLSLALKILELSSYICLYSFLYIVINFKEGKILKAIIRNIYYLVPTILYILSELISSSRITTIQLGCAGIVMGFIIWYKKHKWKKHISFKFILSLILIGIVCLIGFYYSAALIGRQNSKNLLDYITLYAGGSIECFNRYIKYPITQTHVIGGETFILLIKGLNKYGITHLDISHQTAHLEFRYHFNTMIGNVYTAYRRWYNDFGFSGVIALNGFMAFVYNYLYYSFKFNRFKKYSGLVLILFGYISYGLFLHPVDSYFYTTVFQITFITNLVLFTLLYTLLFKFKLKKKKSIK